MGPRRKPKIYCHGLGRALFILLAKRPRIMKPIATIYRPWVTHAQDFLYNLSGNNTNRTKIVHSSIAQFSFFLGLSQGYPYPKMRFVGPKNGDKYPVKSEFMLLELDLIRCYFMRGYELWFMLSNPKWVTPFLFGGEE